MSPRWHFGVELQHLKTMKHNTSNNPNLMRTCKLLNDSSWQLPSFSSLLLLLKVRNMHHMPVNMTTTSNQKTFRLSEYTGILFHRKLTHPMLGRVGAAALLPEAWQHAMSGTLGNLQSFPGLCCSDRYSERNFLFRGGNSNRRLRHIFCELRGNASAWYHRG